MARCPGRGKGESGDQKLTTEKLEERSSAIELSVCVCVCVSVGVGVCVYTYTHSPPFLSEMQ